VGKSEGSIYGGGEGIVTSWKSKIMAKEEALGFIADAECFITTETKGNREQVCGVKH
jgi:hypothetical protein